MGNPFGFEQNPYSQNMGAGPRFPRPDIDESPEERHVSPDPYKRGGKFYRPSSTTLSDTDSNREKENEALRMRLLSMENENKKVAEDKRRLAEEKQRLADELHRLKNQQQQYPSQPQTDMRTPEQTAARDFVHQWSNGPQQRPPPPRQNMDNRQSTMTGLANQFQRMAVDPVQQVLQQLGIQAKQ